MSRFSDYWASQCGNPRGIVGSMVTWVMNRANKVMYDGIIPIQLQLAFSYMMPYT